MLLIWTYQKEANKSSSISDRVANTLGTDTVMWTNFQKTETFISFLKWGYLQGLSKEKNSQPQNSFFGKCFLETNRKDDSTVQSICMSLSWNLIMASQRPLENLEQKSAEPSFSFWAYSVRADFFVGWTRLAKAVILAGRGCPGLPHSVPVP